jgi:hypothetical protein
MATFNEIYHSYLNGVQGIAPISGQQGITSLAKPIVPNTNDNANTNTNYSNNFNQDPNAKSMYSNYYMDNLGFGDILGGISGLASKAMGYPDVGYAIGALTGLGSGGPGMSYGASNYSGAVDTQDLGTLAANEATYGKGFTHDMSTVSPDTSTTSGGMSSSDPGGSDNMGSFANGGRVNFAEGSDIIPFEKIKLFDLLGEELYVDWDSFSEIYDLHGGDRMWKGISGRPGYAMGGRVSYLQGGIVSLLGDYYGKRKRT